MNIPIWPSSIFPRFSLVCMMVIFCLGCSTVPKPDTELSGTLEECQVSDATYEAIEAATSAAKKKVTRLEVYELIDEAEAGTTRDDFLAAMAPKPVMILAKEQDYFDVRGSQQAYERLRRLYRLLGAEENVGLFVGPTTHGYSQENREAMYGWFNRVTGVCDEQAEDELEIESDEAAARKARSASLFGTLQDPTTR